MVLRGHNDDLPRAHRGEAGDEENAKAFAEALVDAGTVDFAEANNSAYGSINDSFVVADEAGYKRPPRAMRKFDGVREVT